MFFEEGPDNRRREKIVTHIRAEGGKRIHLRNPSGLNLQLDIGQDALLTEELTPHKKILQKPILDTPEKPETADGKRSRVSSLSDLDKIEVFEQYILHSKFPFETMKRREMKEDCQVIFDRCSITRCQLKGIVYR